MTLARSKSKSKCISASKKKPDFADVTKCQTVPKGSITQLGCLSANINNALRFCDCTISGISLDKRITGGSLDINFMGVQVRQYKPERECNYMLRQSREDRENPTEGLTCLHISMSAGFKGPKMTRLLLMEERSIHGMRLFIH